MDFSLSKKKTAAQMPEGSGALTIKQLELLQFRKKQLEIDDATYQTIVIACSGASDDTKIPFARVGDVLGGLDNFGEFTKQQRRINEIRGKEERAK